MKKFIEIIDLRAFEPDVAKIKSDIIASLKENKPSEEFEEVAVLVGGDIPGSLAIVTVRNSLEKIEKSQLGLHFYEYLERLGMVSHTVFEIADAYRYSKDID